MRALEAYRLHFNLPLRVELIETPLEIQASRGFFQVG